MLKTAFSIALALAASTPAFAQGPTRTVRYDDLNLSTPAGVAQLDRRIAQAAETICGSAFAMDLSGQADVARCRSATLDGVRMQRDTILASAAKRDGNIRISAR